MSSEGICEVLHAVEKEHSTKEDYPAAAKLKTTRCEIEMSQQSYADLLKLKEDATEQGQHDTAKTHKGQAETTAEQNQN